MDESRRVIYCQSDYFASPPCSDGFNVRGAWSEISRGAAVMHFVVVALWYFSRGPALQHLSSGGLLCALPHAVANQVGYSAVIFIYKSHGYKWCNSSRLCIYIINK